MANFSLPAGRGDFGSGAVELMRPENVFLCLFEYEPAEASQALFSARGIPRPRATDFSPAALQRRLAGQAGCQRFFNQSGRAFCLYAVLGSLKHAATSVSQIHAVLDELRIGAS